MNTETNCFKGYHIEATTNEDGKFATRKEYLKWLTGKFAEIVGE